MRTLTMVALSLGLAAASASAQTPPAARLVPTVAPVAPPTGVVDLAAEFPQIPQLKGYTLAQTVNTIPPNTGRPLHSHAGAPEIVRIISGTLTDARNGGPPTTYGPGSTLLNAAGTQHMWANLGTEPVVFVATQIKPPAP